MKVDNLGQVVQFSEKPRGADLQAMKVDTTLLGLSPQDASKSPYIASMGVYVFKKYILLKLLRWRYPTSNDFGSEIIPSVVTEHNVQAYLFRDYWDDFGTIKSFYDADLALKDEVPKFEFNDPKRLIFTSPWFLPPTKFERSRNPRLHLFWQRVKSESWLVETQKSVIVLLTRMKKLAVM